MISTKLPFKIFWNFAILNFNIFFFYFVFTLSITYETIWLDFYEKLLLPQVASELFQNLLNFW